MKIRGTYTLETVFIDIREHHIMFGSRQRVEHLERTCRSIGRRTALKMSGISKETATRRQLLALLCSDMFGCWRVEFCLTPEGCRGVDIVCKESGEY